MVTEKTINKKKYQLEYTGNDKDVATRIAYLFAYEGGDIIEESTEIKNKTEYKVWVHKGRTSRRYMKVK